MPVAYAPDVAQGVLAAELPTPQPFDYFVWGEIGRVFNKNAHCSSEALKRTIQDTLEKMDRAVVKGAFGRFRSRLERIVVAEGGHIE